MNKNEVVSTIIVLQNRAPGGASFTGTRVKILLYADDLVLLVETPHALQLMINQLENYCKQWDLKINLSKTKTIIFGNFKVQTLNNEVIETVTEFKYLGVTLSSNLNFNKHIKEKCTKAKTAINSMWSKFFGLTKISPVAKYKVFNGVVNSCICYGSAVYGYKEIKEFEKLQLHIFFLKDCLICQVTSQHMLFM